ncbi:hypothetical protein [Priestia aryabhattai]|uniref:hypothetical protein n=1 Tax=Priestia aryabhattai TaxID=412384 RepID=UPI001ADA8104|nr:hypothetical protein [Priestia aryabhattai]QTL51429.1 hypothetical protein J5Z55_10285 [Priestia aryabhattai]
MVNRKADSLKVNLENIQTEDIAAGSFDINRDISEAQKLLKSYEDKRVEKISIDFKRDRWLFKEKYTRSLITFDFKKIHEPFNFEKNKEKPLLIVLKCWLAKKLNETSIFIARNKFMNVTCALLFTKFLMDTDELILNLHQSKLIRIDKEGYYKKSTVSSSVVHRFIADLTDFLDFYNNEQLIDFINRLNEIKRKIKAEKNIEIYHPLKMY